MVYSEPDNMEGDGKTPSGCDFYVQWKIAAGFKNLVSVTLNCLSYWIRHFNPHES